ncbi:MAG: hypothetical protein LBH55_02905 [Mycoplasmataceae bacterium]|jgi:hypothetical protein|nr:hypothetical protein [Mycoplasmataceae bacterium]
MNKILANKIPSTKNGQNTNICKNAPVWFKKFINDVYIPKAEKNITRAEKQIKKVDKLETRMDDIEFIVNGHTKFLNKLSRDVMLIKYKHGKH